MEKSERDMKNILMLKSLNIPAADIQSLEDARKIPELEGFDLKEKYFELVSCPENYVENLPYYFVKGKSFKDNVRVDDIKGTTHQRYYGGNWLCFLMNLEGNRSDYDVDKVVKAINDPPNRESITLDKYGDVYFINGGGNHRVCQAKFLGLETVPCEVFEYVFDEQAYNKTQRLMAIREISPHFEYKSYHNDECIIALRCLGLLLRLRFCDKDISVLEGVIDKARQAAKSPIKRRWNKMRSIFDNKDWFDLSREECIGPLYRALIARMV